MKMKQQIFKNPLDELFNVEDSTGDFMDGYAQVPAALVEPEKTNQPDNQDSKRASRTGNDYRKTLELARI